jgi:hypothetical protein
MPMQQTQITRSRREEGSVLVIALLLMVLLSLLGVTLLTVASTEHSMAFNAFWSEGAISMADAGVNRGVNQLSANAQNSLAAFGPIAIPNGGPYSYRSGRKTDAGAQPSQFVSSRTEPGYSVAMGTGYNPGGYTFDTYQINATGTGAGNAQREAEVRAEYGPVAR